MIMAYYTTFGTNILPRWNVWFRV